MTTGPGPHLPIEVPEDQHQIEGSQANTGEWNSTHRGRGRKDAQAKIGVQEPSGWMRQEEQ